MSGGAGAAERRKPGRPKGSTNRRAKDLQGFIAARYGASAAQQAAAVCMVTPAELKAAGGSMAKAVVAKALDLVQHVRRAQEGRDEWLRQLVREELAGLAGELGADLVKAIDRAVKRISEATAGFGMKEALGMLTAERAALLPYTDQRQPLAIDATVTADRPSVILMGAAPVAGVGPVLENTEVFEGVFSEVAPIKSHAAQQALGFAGEPDDSAPD